jgi:mono/diheme cytochrome c family protein
LDEAIAAINKGGCTAYHTYVKSLREGAWEEQDPIQAAPEPVAIAGTTGEELFISAACNSCHQHDGLGSVGYVPSECT